MSQLDRRVLAEYHLWLAMTVLPVPWEAPRFIAARNYFLAIGAHVL